MGVEDGVQERSLWGCYCMLLCLFWIRFGHSFYDIHFIICIIVETITLALSLSYSDCVSNCWLSTGKRVTSIHYLTFSRLILRIDHSCGGLDLLWNTFTYRFGLELIWINCLDFLQLAILLYHNSSHIIIHDLNDIIIHRIKSLYFLFQLHYFMDERGVIQHF